MANTRDKIDWECPRTKVHISEAEAANLTLIKASGNYRSRIYRFNKCGHEQEIQKHKVKTNSFFCRTCEPNKKRRRITNEKVESKYKLEAEEAGLIYLGRSTHPKRGLYKFKECGHESELAIVNVRIKAVRCNECLSSKHHEEAKKVGLTMLSIGKDYRFRLYKFNECGHEQEIRVANVRTEEFECRECVRLNRVDKAKERNLTFLGVARYNNGLYRFNECGHEQTIHFNALKTGQFKCQECFQIQLENEALEVGLNLIGKGTNSHNRNYKFLECGHEQIIRIDGVRKNSFICNLCFDTYKTQPSEIYLLEIHSKNTGFSWLKLGFAKSTKRRIPEYGLDKSCTVKKIKIIKFDTGEESHKNESALHSKYHDQKLPFAMMKNYMASSGCRECYPLTLKDTLLKELRKIV